jgi:hypothetical protein
MPVQHLAFSAKGRAGSPVANEMQINKLVEELLSEAAVELLNTLAAHAIATSEARDASLFHFAVEEDSWNSTMMLMSEIFEAEILVSGEREWLSFRILQSFGVRQGQLAYQFTPTFAEALQTKST